MIHYKNLKNKKNILSSPILFLGTWSRSLFGAWYLILVTLTSVQSANKNWHRLMPGRAKKHMVNMAISKAGLVPKNIEPIFFQLPFQRYLMAPMYCFCFWTFNLWNCKVHKKMYFQYDKWECEIFKCNYFRILQYIFKGTWKAIV